LRRGEERKDFRVVVFFPSPKSRRGVRGEVAFTLLLSQGEGPGLRLYYSKISV